MKKFNIIEILLFFIIITIFLILVYNSNKGFNSNRNIPRCQMSYVDSMEYYFNPKNSTITVRFYNLSSMFILAGLACGNLDKVEKSLSFTILIELADGKRIASPIFKAGKDGSDVVSFKARGFNPKIDTLYYDDLSNNQRIVPFKGLASEVEVLKLGVR